jgi:asparagine synthase (glutamine-hydrolysing)
VIGAAMIPMYHVSRLAARQVKVCLGGQGADEIFGGYARYALVRPGQVVHSMFTGRRGVPEANGQPSASPVGGNLLKQLASVRNLRRIARRLHPFESATGRYFEHLAKVPESAWRQVFAPEAVSRAKARQQFEEGLRRSPAADPGDRVLHWDLQTYLPGLFHQDDRMSMANSLESRVPLADPRVVRFAMHTPFELKLRAGATKWILRQAVSQAIPESVLNRRKVGFDTPAEAWMRGPHAGFVRELLSTSAARARGFWNARGVQAALDDPGSAGWFDRMWKVVSIEAWAQVFLDRPAPRTVSAEPAVELARP